MKTEVYSVCECSEGDGRYKFVVRGKLNGKYTRKYFATKRDASTWAEIKNIEALNQGIEHAGFSSDLRMQAQAAAELLKPHGATLLEAVKIALPILQARGKSIPVNAAVELFLEDYRLNGGPKTTVPSASYLDYLSDMLGPFKRLYGDRLVANVDAAEIEALLHGRKNAGAVTRQSYVRAISAFYGWCVRKGYRLDTPPSAPPDNLEAQKCTNFEHRVSTEITDVHGCLEARILPDFQPCPDRARRMKMRWRAF